MAHLLGQWLFFAALSVVFVCLLRSVRAPVYLNNDNEGIVGIAEDGFLAPFVHFVWSYMLTGLYALHSEVPWYGLLLYALQAGALSVVLTMFYRAIPHRGFFCLFAIVVLFFWADMLVRLDYTTTSIMVGASAVLLFALLQREDRATWKQSLLLGLLVALSALPRAEGIIAVVLVAGPFLVILWFMALKRSARPMAHIPRNALPFVCLLLPGLLVYLLNDACRDNLLTEEERVYERFNELRGRFHDFPIAAANLGNRRVHEATGWTESDYIRLVRWMFFDERIYDIERLQAFYRHASCPDVQATSIRQIGLSVYHVLRTYCEAVLLMAAGLALIWGRGMVRLPDFIMCCVAAGAALGIAVTMDLFLRFPYQIGYPMLLFAGLLLFVFAVTPRKAGQPAVDEGDCTADAHPDRRAAVDHAPLPTVRPNALRKMARTCVVPAAVLLACLAHGVRLSRHYRAIDAECRFREAVTRYIDGNHPGSFLIAEPGLTPFHFCDPIRPPQHSFTRIPLGWSTFHPWFYRKLKAMGLERGAELMPAMMSRDDILVLTSQPGMELLLQYSHQEGFGDPQVERLNEWGGVILYRLRAMPASSS
ncbi:MAG: hypothetical protein RBS80_27330 [Thermoguttaceae bacterium]|jgi:hypothetical protein|nr:hypothetical protein [Thermoguttaceae bacterium]